MHDDKYDGFFYSQVYAVCFIRLLSYKCAIGYKHKVL